MFRPNAKWTRKYIDSLPDSAFLFIDETACEYREGGRSHPLSCRKFPYRDRQGRVDLPHLRNAIARAPQSDLTKTEIKQVQKLGRDILAGKHESMAANGQQLITFKYRNPYGKIVGTRTGRYHGQNRSGRHLAELSDMQGLIDVEEVDVIEIRPAREEDYSASRLRRNSSCEVMLHATPYDISHVGFYFKDFEEYEEKYEREHEKYGVEEYEIQFIDGPSIALAIFEVMEVSQAKVEAYFETVEEICGDEERELAFQALQQVYSSSDIDYIKDNLDEVQLFEGSPKDYAYELVDDIGISDEWKETYFDYESFGSDLSITGDDVSGSEEEIERLRESGDEDDADEADRLQEWVDEVESWSDRKRGEEFIESLGGIDQISDPERYFDYEALARDLVLGGDVAEVRIDGTDYVITNASSL